MSPALAGRFFTTEPPGQLIYTYSIYAGAMLILDQISDDALGGSN